MVLTAKDRSKPLFSVALRLLRLLLEQLALSQHRVHIPIVLLWMWTFPLLDSSLLPITLHV